MNRFLSIAWRVVLLFGLVAGGYIWATGTIDSLYAYRSPITNSPPVPGSVPVPALTRRVVFVLIDGLRVDTSLKADVMPNLVKLRDQAAVAITHSQPPSYSEPGYSTLLTGAWPDINSGPAVNLDYGQIPTITQDTLFSAAHRAGLKTAISGFNWFENLVPQDAVNFHFYTAGEDQQADRDVMTAAMSWLADPGVQLVLIHLDQVDYAGHHEGGPRDPRWDAAAKRCDDLLGEVLAKLDLSQDTIFVASDHGHIDRGGHGGQDPVVLIEPFVLAGKGVKPGNYYDVHMVDIAPTLAVLLGTNLPASSQGHAQVQMLALSQEQVAKISEVEQAQQAKLTQLYQAAVTPGQSTGNTIDAIRLARLTSERLPRGLIALLVFLATFIFIIWKRDKNLIWYIVAVLIYLIVFNVRYLLIDARTYSLSSVDSVSQIITYFGITCSVALLAAQVFVAWRTQLLGQKPYQVFLIMVDASFILITILSWPVLFSFFINGWKATWTLPDFASAFFGFAGTLQILMVSMLTFILAGLWSLAASVHGIVKKK